MDNFPLKKETHQIIGVFMEAQRTLSYSFLATNYTNEHEKEILKLITS